MSTELAVTPDKQGRRRLSPTDVSQFLRLEQCERYLRLRLHERSGNYTFLPKYGVYPQSIPPLLTRSGADFEAAVETAITAHFPTHDFGTAGAPGGQRTVDNDAVVEHARSLPNGSALVLFQPRLLVDLDGWLVRGDVDILRLERDADGTLRIMIADMKSSTSAKVEHRLQVAFYYEMLAALYRAADVPYADIAMAVLYRGPTAGDEGLAEADRDRHAVERAQAELVFGTKAGLLEIVAEPDSYRGAVRDLVTGPDSTAVRVAGAPFDDVPFHLAPRCDGCLYNEFCMKRSAQHDDLSLIPHLTIQDKTALHRAGVTTALSLALLKDLPAGTSPSDPAPSTLVPVPANRNLVNQLAATWPVGPRLDELIHRARRYRAFKNDPLRALSYIPSKGYGSLPYADAVHNPNLVMVYVDVQQDYLADRVYLLGALVVADGNGLPQRRRAVTRMTEGPPDAPREQSLLTSWLDAVILAIVELAAPDDQGLPRAPIHLVVYSDLVRTLLLDALGRHAAQVLSATPLYDFVTQLAAFDSPIVTILEQEIRELKNYPMVCQSLQATAALLKFDWNTPKPFRTLFRERMFDFWGKLKPPEQDDPSESPWYTSRARFGSQIPLEYAYAAWGQLQSLAGMKPSPEGALDDPPAPTGPDDYAPYRKATPELIHAFQARHVEAMEHVAGDFKGNQRTEKRAFDLPNLRHFTERAQTMAQALVEFVTVERHVSLGEWKSERLAPPERRVLSGATLLVRYDPADQEPGVADRNRENLRRQALREQFRAAYRAAHPDAKRITLPKDQKIQSDWSQAGMPFRLRVECTDVDCSLAEALSLATLDVGDWVVLSPRTTVDSRLPLADQTPFTPTPKAMLYRPRAEIEAITVDRDACGEPIAAYVTVVMKQPMGGKSSNGFTFGAIDDPFRDGECYTLDEDPNDIYGSFCLDVVQGLVTGGRNTLYDRLVDPSAARVTWPPEASAGQQRFLAGLDAMAQVGAFHGMEESKRAYIGGYGDAPTLLVQGPPGTGKSYATAFAVFARLQGAMAADRDLRVFVSCKTHAATDVLLKNLRQTQQTLKAMAAGNPTIFAAYFDARLLDLPLFRVRPNDPQPAGIVSLPKDNERAPGSPTAVEAINARRWCVVGAAPAGIRGLLKDTWSKDLYGHAFCDCLVLDEASQMSLPEAIMAALPLREDGQILIVGDHRQMPPIVAHDWSTEPRRTFKEFRSYESLFLTLLPLGLPIVKFAESFRLHADMAEFLRQEIYRHDGIAYHSNQHSTLLPFSYPDPFVAAVLSPAHALVVVVHDEESSQVRNPFEQALITPVLEALADPAALGLQPEDGLGVVVPHRAQRAALRDSVPALTRRDPATGAVLRSAVDTVERFQGDERTAILVDATESEREYLLASSKFLLDPRRLTVALSRSKSKMILVASRSIFGLFSVDEDTFVNAQMWKNLLRQTCTLKLWEGERHGHHVQVWGNVPGQNVPSA